MKAGSLANNKPFSMSFEYDSQIAEVTPKEDQQVIAETRQSSPPLTPLNLAINLRIGKIEEH